MKEYLKGIGAQVTAILIAATGAAAITFIQSLAVQSGACDISPDKVADAGFLGGVLKAAHSAFYAMNHRHFL